MSHIMRSISVVLLCFISVLSMADDFIDFETSAHRLSSYYRAYIFFEGDKKYKTLIAEIASKASVYDELLAEKPQLLQQWHKLAAQVNQVLANENDIRNVNTQAHWEMTLADLNRILKDEVENGSYNKSFSDVNSDEYIRLVLLRMEKILAIYMALTNPVGGFGISAESPALDEKTLEISTMLAAIKSPSPALSRVVKKWGFVKKIILKYNTNIAPYIVMHSYNKIRINIDEYRSNLE